MVVAERLKTKNQDK